MILKLDTKEVTITNFYENLSENATLNASNNFEVEATAVFPDFSGLKGFEFATLQIKNADGITIPTIGSYSKVESINVTYDDRSRVYTANIVLV